MDRSMFCEPAAMERKTPSTRIGATSRSLLQELIAGTLPAPDLYIPDENRGNGMYGTSYPQIPAGTSPYPQIAAGAVHPGGSNHAPRDGKVPHHDATGLMGASDLDYGNAICGNQALMENIIPSERENIIPSESSEVTIASQAYAEVDAPTYNERGLWTLNEDRKLRELVSKIGVKKWSKIAKDLPGRIGKQCRERWMNHLKPGIKETAWTEEEYQMLITWHRKLGTGWAKMAKHIPGRPENSLKNRWNATWRHVKKNKETIEMAVKDGTHPNALVVYMVRECGALTEGACAPARAADPPVPDAVPDGWQVDNNPAATEPSPGSNSPDQWWLPMLLLCGGGTLPPPIMEAPAPLPDHNNVESCVYATYDTDGYMRYVHLQPTPGHDGDAPANQVVAAAAEAPGYYNPLTFPYNPLAGQQVYAHTTYPAAAGSYGQEAVPSYCYSNSGGGGDEAHGNAGSGSAAPELAGMPFSANAPAAQNQRGGGAI